MNASEALNLLNKSLTDYQLTDWTGKLDNARRRFGLCRMSKKQISLSRHLCALNSDAEVRDTILHEIAHALAWERHGENCGHDKRWQAICVEVGARPVACFDDEVIQPKAPWVLANRETGEVYRSYFKRPTRDWSKVWIRGRKAQTHGKLEVRANTETPKTGDLFSDPDATNMNTTDTKAESKHNKSTTITRFTADSVADFRNQVIENIADLVAEHGVQISNAKGRYSDNECALTLTFSIPGGADPVEAENNQRIEFEALATLFSLQADHYRSQFTVNGQAFNLIGFKPNNHKYPIIGSDARGKKYKFEETVLDQIED